jgi:adenosylhomocysteine nucleosidase
MRTPRLGIVTGTRIEAACLVADDAVRTACSGADAARARDLATRLLAEGCAALASIGTAGGLDEALAPGAVVIADSVIAADGAHFAADPRWRAALAERLTAGGMGVNTALIAGSDAAVPDGVEKRRLRQEIGAACCDMESHAVAAVAAASCVPFIAVRAVADPAALALPQAALAAVDPDGALRLGALAAALLARPGDIGDMIRLARASRMALRSLRRVAALGGPLLALA